MILIAGATGHLGVEICRRLRDRRAAVRALVRSTADPNRAHALRDMGVELFMGDLTDTMSVAAACQDVGAVINAASSVLTPRNGNSSLQSVERDGALSLVEFSRVLGVRHFVYVTLPRNLKTHCPLLRARAEVEDRVSHCGLPYTILCTNYFMESWLDPALGFDYVNGAVKIFGEGQHPIGWVSCGDVAEIAVRALDTPAARNRYLDVAGPENISPREAVRIFEDVSERRFTIEETPESALDAEYKNARNPLERSIAALKLEYAHGCPMDVTDTLRRVPMQLTSVADYARRVAAPQTATV
jgi:uncharacterized protein YbjT (DUF2867 family)